MPKNKGQTITPYANESEVVRIGDIYIENRTDRITINGNTDITIDKEGLEKALAIKQLIDSILAVLQSRDLPDKIEIIKPSTIKNPFGRPR